MTEAARMAEQMRRVMVGGAWHGPSVLEALDGLPAAAAALHPVPGAHSVWDRNCRLSSRSRAVWRVALLPV